jgi:nucleoside 2-deoxyribosyltransferase
MKPAKYSLNTEIGLKIISKKLEKFGHTVFCALRADQYKINDADPAKAIILDEAEITAAQGMLAFVNDKVSTGVQTEIGMAIALKKLLVLAHTADIELTYFNRAVALAGQASELIMPIVSDPFLVKS